MDKICILIVDDEPLARTRIRDLLKRDPDVDVITECADSFEAISAIRDRAPELVFLDVQMPEKDGFYVIEEIGIERMPIFIFVTAYDQYAIQAFETYAFDYLLKPFTDTRFEKTMQRAKKQIRGQREGDLNQRLLSLVDQWRAQTNYLDRIMINAQGRLFFLRTDEIDWMKSEGNYVRLRVGTSSYLIRDTITNLERQLNPKQFLRIHRSMIVNFDSVKELEQLFHGDYRVTLKDGTQLQFSRNYRQNLPRLAQKLS